MSKLNIEIDCAPGATRPDVYFKRIMKSLGEVYSDDKQITSFVEKNKDIEKISACFGNWEWNIEVEDEAIFNKVQSHFKNEITKLYNNGLIRFGSW